MNKNNEKNQKKFKNSQKGITLIALVITIIVLLILAGVAISQITGNSSILNKVQNASDETRYAEELSQVQLKVLGLVADSSLGTISNDGDKITTALSGIATFKENGTQAGTWVFTGNTGREYTISSNGGVTPGDKPGSPATTTPTTITTPTVNVEVGDVIYYSPNKRYEVNKDQATSYATDTSNYTGYKYILANGTEYTGLSDTTYANDMTITKWKVWKKNGTSLTLVPEAPTTGTIRLQGAQGYNNAVTLLDTACSTLYGDSGKGITARSIDMEDIEGAMNASAISTAKTNDNYGTQKDSAYTQANSWYPAIYAYENDSVITPAPSGITKSLGLSAGMTLMGRTENGASALGKVQAGTSIQPKQTYYYMDNSTFNTALGTNASYILPSGSSTPNYWVASRCVYLLSSFCYFYVRYVLSGELNAYYLFDSGDDTGNNTLRLFPVVSLGSSALQETTQTGCDFEVK